MSKASKLTSGCPGRQAPFFRTAFLAIPEETCYGLLMLNQTYEFKLLPTNAQVETFDSWLRICVGVWNHALAERRDFACAQKSPVNACSIRQEYIIVTYILDTTIWKEYADWVNG